MNILKKHVLGFTIGALMVIALVAVLAVKAWSMLEPKVSDAVDKVTGKPNNSTPPTEG